MRDEPLLLKGTVVDIYNAEKEVWELAAGRVLNSGRKTFTSNALYWLEAGPNWQQHKEVGVMDVRRHIVFDILATTPQGVVIPWPTGISITNQTGGSYCEHPVVEGFFYPMELIENEEEEDAVADCLDAVQKYDEAKVLKFLEAVGFDDVFEPVPRADWKDLPMASEGRELQEAWVPVCIRREVRPAPDPEEDEEGTFSGVAPEDMLSQFQGRIVYLTYANSD